MIIIILIKVKMKNYLILSLFLSMIVLYSCQKEEMVQNKTNNEENIFIEEYIYEGISYFLEYSVERENYIVVDNKNNELIQNILDKENTALLINEQKENSYYVFNNYNELKVFLNIKESEKLNNSKAIRGSVDIFADRHFVNHVGWYTIYGDGGISSLGTADDKASSYDITGSTAVNEKIVVTFFEHPNYGGNSLTATVAPNPIPGDSYHGADGDLHNNLMSGRLWWKKYWGDRISSIKWFVQYI